MEADDYFGFIDFEGSSKQEDTFNKNVKVYEKDTIWQKFRVAISSNEEKVKDIVTVALFLLATILTIVVIVMLTNPNVPLLIPTLMICSSLLLYILVGILNV